jgi:predicted GNAT family acetyltransferase
MPMALTNVTIRKATKEDLPHILSLYSELHPNDPPINEDSATSVWNQALYSGVTYFVAESRGTIVATCYIAIIPNITKQCSPIGFIENIITSDSYRRLGIAKRLLEAVVEYAKAQGCYKVTLQSNVKRTVAHEFYKSVGFDGNSKRAFEIRL